jgi:hypothetical protein
MLGTMMAIVDAGAMQHAHGRGAVLAAITCILEAGHKAGDIRRDTSAEDVSTCLVGIFSVAGAPTQRAQLARLLDLLMDGLRPSAARTSR